MTGHRSMLLSLRPRFADAILSGTKTVELRRQSVNAQPEAVTTSMTPAWRSVVATTDTAAAGRRMR
jgi:predicted transcriptional regulator